MPIADIVSRVNQIETLVARAAAPAAPDAAAFPAALSATPAASATTTSPAITTTPPQQTGKLISPGPR
jgi:hypothetical protein